MRHGRTEWNREHRFQGHTDIPLDATGEAQAQALGDFLHDVAFSFAITSDLWRSRRTAARIIAGRNVPLRADPRWREMRFGAWEGLTWSEIVKQFPEARERPNPGRFVTPEGGESFAELRVRVEEALSDMRGIAVPGASVLLTTHAGPLHALLHVALGQSEAESMAVRFEPASVTRLAVTQTGARIVALNELPPAAQSA